MPNLLTIKDISNVTGLEESLLRFYESEYPEELPEKTLLGGTLTFKPAAVESFKKIHSRHTSAQPSFASMEEPTKKSYARVIAVTSGKGGVGKTNIALNLAIELQKLGKMTIVLDADMGMANVHLLAGINPEHDLMDLIAKNARISDLIMEGPEGIGIIPGGGGIVGLADSTKHERKKIILALQQIEQAADVVIVDTGAGMAANVRDFLVAADELLFVLTSDITSLADAYGLLKVLHNDNHLAEKPIYSVVNMAETLKEAADIALRFSSCAEKFLGREVINLAYLMKDTSVRGATVRRKPYTVFKPHSRISKNTRNLAAALMQNEMPEIQLTSAFGRYLKLLKRD